MKKRTTKRRKQDQRPPWAWAAALLAGCVVTLVCMGRQMDPDVILLRVLVASSVTGATVATTLACLRSLASKH